MCAFVLKDILCVSVPVVAISGLVWSESVNCLMTRAVTLTQMDCCFNETMMHSPNSLAGNWSFK